MTPACFDTRRRLLGLSVQETADWCGVQRKTVQRWASGYSDIPDSAIERLIALEDAMSRAVDELVALAAEKGADVIELKRYRDQPGVDASPHAAGMPAGAHAILIGWTSDALEEAGHEVEIIWGD